MYVAFYWRVTVFVGASLESRVICVLVFWSVFLPLIKCLIGHVFSNVVVVANVIAFFPLIPVSQLLIATTSSRQPMVSSAPPYFPIFISPVVWIHIWLLAWICISSLSKLFLFSKKETHRPCNEKRNIWIISAGAAAIVKASTRGPSRRLLSTVGKTRKIKLQGKHYKEFKFQF